MPNIDYFAAASTAVPIVAPTEVSATGYSVGVDTSNFVGKAMLVTGIVNTAGTDPTLEVAFETSDAINVLDGDITFAGDGDGTLTQLYGGPATAEETITLTFTKATEATVAGSITGSIGTATVGEVFTSDYVTFLLTAGATPFAKDDEFSFDVLEQTYTAIDVDPVLTDDTAVIARTVIDTDTCGQWIRAAMTIDGTDSPKFFAGVTAYGMVNS